jgi:tetratricopeptide (TPR) repeat protein
LVERDAELDALEAALADAATGAGSVILLAGEAGSGKSSVLRAFQARVGSRGRVLIGACDDLLTPRVLGPLLEAGGDPNGPLAAALASGQREEVMTGVLTELDDPRAPTVLIVDDAQWADDATIDVLRFVSRRIDRMAALLIISYRDNDLGPSHPLRRLLGRLDARRVRRIRLRSLSVEAVAGLAGLDAGAAADLQAVTGGNPFFVTEVLAAPGEAVPPTVVDAVMARLHDLEPVARHALDQLSVMPAKVGLALAREVLGSLSTALPPAERAGIVAVYGTDLTFRHELARRAVESSLTSSERMTLNARVLSALLNQQRPDLPRILHHAVAAGDDLTVARFAFDAAAAASAAGAYRQEIGFYQLIVDRPSAVTAVQLATAYQGLALALFTVGRMHEGLAAGVEAVRQREELDDPAALGTALCAVAPIYWSLNQSQASVQTAARAVQLLTPAGDSPARAFALIYYGLLLTATHLEPDPMAVAAEALAVAQRVDAADLEALAHTLQGRGRYHRGEPGWLEEMQLGLSAAQAVPHHAFVMMSYVVLAQDCFDAGRYEDAAHTLADGARYGREREVDFYADLLSAYEYRLQELHGRWLQAEVGLRRLVGVLGRVETGAERYALPTLARLLVRRGAADAAQTVMAAESLADQAGGYYEAVPTALLTLEAAWLARRPAQADAAIDLLTRITARPGREHARGQLHRWLRRLGREAGPFPGCPDVLAAGISGDWVTAALGWERIGAPYEQALELADSGSADATAQACQILSRLGAEPALAIARDRLQALSPHDRG